MDQVRLGRTGIVTNRNGFGALPVQRVPMEEAVRLLRMALDGGMTYFDTARSYTDSEEKLGRAFEGRRNQLFLATKTPSVTVEGFWRDLETSLRLLRTDCIDVYQFHNPSFCPRPGDGTGLYEAMLEARAQGKIRFIGITNHSAAIAAEAIASGLYDTLQYPFSYLAADRDIRLVEDCAKADMGFVAMKSLSGGLITNAAAAYAFAAQFPGALPIWGIQREKELREFLSFMDAPPRMTEEMRALIEHDREELSGDFCRGCGYCMPCPAGIEINNCARISLLVRRSPTAYWLGEEGQAKMAKIRDCLNCGRCRSRCPYHLDTPALLRKNLADYENIIAGRVEVRADNEVRA